jgi:SAM-dependent methyltransferase
MNGFTFGTRAIERVLHRLVIDTKGKRVQFQEGFNSFALRHGLTDWEGWFSPYDDETYAQVLQNIGEDDVILDIGAGDLRLALQMAERARRVYAIEVNPKVIGPALEAIGWDLPRNLVVICANALDIPFPSDVTAAVLLMRHCQHFRDYVIKLRVVGCRRLITNARWKAWVEVIDLTCPGIPFDQVRGGWYACRCGAVGYVPYDQENEEEFFLIHEVESCPYCRP